MAGKPPQFETTRRCPPYVPPLDTIRVGEHDRHNLLVVSPFITWVHLHWNGQHDVMHHPEPGDCPHCGHLPDKWKGFLAVLRHKDPTFYLLQLTQFAGQRFEDQAPDENIRGLSIMVGRERPTMKAPVLVTIKNCEREKELPAAPDLTGTFVALWGPQAGKKRKP